jgi:hypothetical protein
MSKESTDYLKVLFAANIVCIASLILTGWFAYIDNGYWGWPFALAVISACGPKSKKDRVEEDIEIEEMKRKKYNVNQN